MLGFEPRISGVKSDRSTNWADVLLKQPYYLTICVCVVRFTRQVGTTRDRYEAVPLISPSYSKTERAGSLFSTEVLVWLFAPILSLDILFKRLSHRASLASDEWCSKQAALFHKTKTFLNCVTKRAILARKLIRCHHFHGLPFSHIRDKYEWDGISLLCIQ